MSSFTRNATQKQAAITAVAMNARGDTSKDVSATIRPKAAIVKTMASKRSGRGPTSRLDNPTFTQLSENTPLRRAWYAHEGRQQMADQNDFAKLEKHQAILKFLTNLEQRLGSGAFQIIDHWESDLNAIGAAHPRNRELLAYIAAYGPNDLYVELELPPHAGSQLPYSVAGEFRSLTSDEAARIVGNHLAWGRYGDLRG